MNSDSVIIPYEERRGSYYVSSFVVTKDNDASLYNFIDSNVSYLGPIGINRVDIDSSSILEGVSRALHKEVEVVRASVEYSRDKSNSACELVIEGLCLYSKEGLKIEMRRNLTGYPYELSLLAV